MAKHAKHEAAHDAAEHSSEQQDHAAALAEAQARSAELEQKLAEAVKRADEAAEQTRGYAAAYDKARVEFAAVKERMAREYERSLKRDQAKAITGLLTVLDNLDRSLESVKPGAAVADSFVDGVRMIRGQLDQALGAMGLTRFDGLGERFDPLRHQAITTMPVADQGQDNAVVHSVSSGCIFGDEVVRPATVVVGKFVGAAD